MQEVLEKYRRPRLCRLCECPVVDGALRVVRWRLDRLSRWWKAHWDIDFDRKPCSICQFCVWDLRFADENSDVKEPKDQNWWSQLNKKSSPDTKYQLYRDELMKPCLVKGVALQPSALKWEREKTNKKGENLRCFYCLRTFPSFEGVLVHAKTAHPKELLRCRIKSCRKFILNKEEQKKHLEKVHSQNHFTCIYCGKVSYKKPTHNLHLNTKHKGQIIKCKYGKNCSELFKTEKERDQHFEEKHNSGNYFCCFCNRYFESYKLQWSHMRKCHKEALKCNATRACPNYFKTEEDRQKHIQEKHNKDPIFNCLYCFSTFQNIATFRWHLNQKHQGVFIKCKEKCFTFFKSEGDRQKHHKEVHDWDTFFCIYCDKLIVGIKSGLWAHVNTYHSADETIKCDYTKCTTFFKTEEAKLTHCKEKHETNPEHLCFYCGKFFPKYLIDHIQKNHKDVAIRCNFNKMCPNYFQTTEDRDKHVKEVHQVEKFRQPSLCVYCDKIQLDSTLLRTHVNSLHKDVAIKCPHLRCGHFFKSKEDLESHLQQAGHKPAVKNSRVTGAFACLFCPKVFKTKEGLNQHKNIVHREKEKCPHCKILILHQWSHVVSSFCKICNQKFVCKGLFRRHNLECKPTLQCPVCAKVFKTACELKYHCKRKHTVPILKWKGLDFESRGHKCEDCFTYFKSRDCLARHNNSCHTFAFSDCDICGKQFANKSRLEQHILRVHFTKSDHFKCRLCDSKFRYKVDLSRHRLNYHHEIKEIVKCEICTKSFNKIYLKKHMLYMH